MTTEKIKSVKINKTVNGYGEPETILDSASKNKIGILEISTKAVKLLTGNINDAIKDFNFDNFFNYSILTNTGAGLDSNNKMDMDYFLRHVSPAIASAINKAKENNVGSLYSISTAVLRSAKSPAKIIKWIYEKHKINVRILSKEEEAKVTFDAFSFGAQGINVKLTGNILLIDQGGGSTELIISKGRTETPFLKSLDIGTLSLKNLVIENKAVDFLLSDAFLTSDKEITKKINRLFTNTPGSLSFFQQSNNKINLCIGMGTAITKATSCTSNKQQHGKILTLNKISEIISNSEKNLIEKYKTVGELINNQQIDSKIIDNLIAMRLGLKMFELICQKLNIPEIVVCGTALRYGFFYQKAVDLINNL